MKPVVLFVTGTDTAVGKTVLAALLTRRLRAQGFRVAGLKPLCSGGRADALALQAAAANGLTVDEVNPWHFRAPLAPLLAARRERRRVESREVVAHIRRVTRRFDVAVVEGAGGLLSPLGEGFDSRDLIRSLRAIPVVACPNRLGAVNQALLVLNALAQASARRAQVVLMRTTGSESAGRTNASILRELAGGAPVYELPHFREPAALDDILRGPQIRRTVDTLLSEIVDRWSHST